MANAFGQQYFVDVVYRDNDTGRHSWITAMLTAVTMHCHFPIYAFSLGSTLPAKLMSTQEVDVLPGSPNNGKGNIVFSKKKLSKRYPFPTGFVNMLSAQINNVYGQVSMRRLIERRKLMNFIDVRC